VIDNVNTIKYEIFRVIPEMQELAKRYVEQGIISVNDIDDALHIAIATIIGVDVLVSCNFKHIVKSDRIKRFNEVNIQEGHNPINIMRPKEFIKMTKKKEPKTTDCVREQSTDYIVQGNNKYEIYVNGKLRITDCVKWKKAIFRKICKENNIKTLDEYCDLLEKNREETLAGRTFATLPPKEERMKMTQGEL
jgi:hypothetical protein